MAHDTCDKRNEDVTSRPPWYPRLHGPDVDPASDVHLTSDRSEISDTCVSTHEDVRCCKLAAETTSAATPSSPPHLMSACRACSTFHSRPCTACCRAQASTGDSHMHHLRRARRRLNEPSRQRLNTGFRQNSLGVFVSSERMCAEHAEPLVSLC